MTAVTGGSARGTLVQACSVSARNHGPTGAFAFSVFINFSQCMLPAVEQIVTHLLDAHTRAEIAGRYFSSKSGSRFKFIH